MPDRHCSEVHLRAEVVVAKYSRGGAAGDVEIQANGREVTVLTANVREREALQVGTVNA
jgi:hypothetical protein